MHMCFNLGGKRICIHVPVSRFPPDFPPPPDDPRTDAPQPEPWLTGGDLTREIAADLSALASIDVLVQRLHSPALRTRLTRGLEAAVPEFKLGHEVEVVFDQHMHR